MSDTRSPDSFTFAMGEFDATFPLDRSYAKNHMWAQRRDGSVWRFGLSAYAVRLLQDVYFLDWEVDLNAPIAHRQMIGAIESKKAESDLYSPIAGSLIAINQAVLSDPALINADTYESGWLIEIRSDDVVLEDALPTGLLTTDEYKTHLEGAWVIAQRTIKGQANN
ncbi:glycine cleavage system protein H [Roseiconus lacunae]|uniref:Glycine cleavage system protein H n=1 Tax=Roseiconus lacunae TaxID=2605694 RepID=A0ABT7PD84_9BACT|nr:glycine cleavage system protein H [Roseiconus lacunae]MCD0459760.1 glycine cleavage system protein H [Roseiconus lacunae]MDM4014457.1 glycine cleavage system protein H [Roseiconus lacunae]WRQ49772.1 glycine cleavage system protein H [Stieleria sp. HD01]